MSLIDPSVKLLFAVVNQDGKYVAGFNEDHMVVELAQEPSNALNFLTVSSAEAWACDLVGAGFGLVSFKVVEHPLKYLMLRAATARRILERAEEWAKNGRPEEN
jgi:hypothetical protein